MKTALVIGSRGMDGSNLCKYLLDEGYTVIGADRHSSSPNYWRHKELGIENKFTIESIDLTDFASVGKIVNTYKPDEIYNLGAMSFVGESFKQPVATFNVNANGQLNVLEAVRNFSPSSKLYFASTSETFGKVQQVPQTEETPFYPRSLYGCAKLAGFDLTRNYREAYGLYACSGILFNHEGPLRGEEFVTRKITSNVAKWYYGKLKTFELGNLNSERDWGDSEDYVIAMNLMLQQNIPDDFVIATGNTRSIRDFIKVCFEYICIDIEFVGEGLGEKVMVKSYEDPIITINKNFFRPTEVDQLVGNYAKAKKILGWEPETSFKQLVFNMMEADIEREKIR